MARSVELAPVPAIKLVLMHFRFGVEIDSNWDFMNGLLPRVRETFDFLRFN